MSLPSPALNAEVGPYAAAVPASRFDVSEPARRRRGFSKLILSPTHGGPVRPEPAAVLTASMDGLELPSRRGLSGPRDTAPAQCEARGQQATGMFKPGGYGDKPEVTARYLPHQQRRKPFLDDAV